MGKTCDNNDDIVDIASTLQPSGCLCAVHVTLSLSERVYMCHSGVHAMLHFTSPACVDIPGGLSVQSLTDVMRLECVLSITVPYCDTVANTGYLVVYSEFCIFTDYMYSRILVSIQNYTLYFMKLPICLKLLMGDSSGSVRNVLEAYLPILPQYYCKIAL